MNISSVEEAASYNDVSAVYLQNRLNTELLKLATFDKMDTVLEVGCGPGTITRQLASLVKSIIGNILRLPLHILYVGIFHIY